MERTRVCLIGSPSSWWRRTRTAVKALPKVQVVSEALVPAEAFAAPAALSPDAVIVACTGTGSSGAAALASVAKHWPTATLIVVAEEPEHSTTIANPFIGAVLLARDVTAETLNSALRLCATGPYVVRRSRRQLERRREGRPAQSAAKAARARRDQQILSGLASGDTLAEIGETVNRCVSTVQRSIRGLCARFEVESTMALVAKAGRQGLLPEVDER